ncbi:MAG: autoinducer 2-degrading protein [Planctomycetota bacterium]|jgi:autoinducer 2-degrading protein
MPKFAIQVTMRVHDGQADAFLALIQTAAQAAVAKEPECHAFHVGQSEDDPHVFMLFEVYSDAAALAFHHQQEHFQEFRVAAADLIADKSATKLELFN